MQGKIVQVFFLLSVFIFSCSHDKQPVAPTLFSIEDISNTSYNIIAKNDAGTVILLGHIHFTQSESDQISGTWNLETWGKNSLFPTLPVNEGKKFPDDKSLGTFTGYVFGEQAIVKLSLPSSDNSLGMIVKGTSNGKLVGKITLLPGKEFDGNFEAIRTR
jgi:hypothetical protein